jgi:hypothetical protein
MCMSKVWFHTFTCKLKCESSEPTPLTQFFVLGGGVCASSVLALRSRVPLQVDARNATRWLDHTPLSKCKSVVRSQAMHIYIVNRISNSCACSESKFAYSYQVASIRRWRIKMI